MMSPGVPTFPSFLNVGCVQRDCDPQKHLQIALKLFTNQGRGTALCKTAQILGGGAL